MRVTLGPVDVAMGSLAKLHGFRLCGLNRTKIALRSVLADSSSNPASFFGCKVINLNMSYTTVERGAPNTTDFRIYFSKYSYHDQS